jgi:hypothetical protein
MASFARRFKTSSNAYRTGRSIIPSPMPLLIQWLGHTALAAGTTIRKTVIMQAANATGKIRLGIEHLMQIVESFGHIPGKRRVDSARTIRSVTESMRDWRVLDQCLSRSERVRIASI